MHRTAYVSVAILVTAACGGASAIDGDGSEYAGAGGGTSSSSQGGSGGSGGSGASGGSGGMTGYVRCPDALPQNGEPCAIQDLWCTYGDDARPNCRDLAFCAADYWYVVERNCGPQTCSSPPTAGTVCNTEGEMCAFEGGPICICSSCFGGPCQPPPPEWQCSSPAADCPAIMPNAGTACSKPGTSCSYGDPCGGGFELLCNLGEWTVIEEVCPL